MYSNETITNFLTLRSQGLSYDKIAKELNVSKHTLLGWAKQYRPPIDQKLQSALETYHASLVHRAEALAQQFQTITQALSTCDPTGSRYPRLAGLFLKFHHALHEFDFNPGALPENCTKTAPVDDPGSSRTEHSARTKTAPTPSSDADYSPTALESDAILDRAARALSAAQAAQTAPAPAGERQIVLRLVALSAPLSVYSQQSRYLPISTKTTPEPISAFPIRQIKSKFQNLPPSILEYIRKKMDYIEAKIAS